jgi:hypothetical protein
MIVQRRAKFSLRQLSVSEDATFGGIGKSEALHARGGVTNAIQQTPSVF